MALTSGQLVGGSVPNWTLVTSSAPSGVSTVTFSGLSGYSKFRIVANLTMAASGTLGDLLVRVNNDSTATDYVTAYSSGTSTGGSIGKAGVAIANPSAMVLSNQESFQLEIDNALTVLPKSIDFFGSFNNGNVVVVNGKALFFPTSVITSLSVVHTGTATFSGSIYLEGAN